MTEHVLECDWNKVCHVYKEVRAEGIIDRTYDAHRDFYGKGQCCQCGIKCECARLRACEERVAEETEAAMIQSFYWKPSPPHDWHYFADNICAYCFGRSEALDAAQEAIEATFIGWCKDYMNCTDYEHVCGKRREIITAINALREKS